jgi:hypothetical protein
MLKELREKRRQVQHILFTSKIDPPNKASKLANDLTDPNSSRLARFRAGVHLIARPVNVLGYDLEGAIHNAFYDPTELPFKFDNLNLIGYGAECEVFSVGQDNSHVVKLDTRSMAMKSNERLARANELKRGHEQIKRWFENIDGFVTPTSIVISRLPFMARPAVGIVQPYFKEIRGVFEDLTSDHLLSLFDNNKVLGDSFVAVVDKLSEIFRQSGLGIDINGERNLSIVDDNGLKKLVLLDSCDIVDLNKNNTKKKKLRIARYRLRLDRLCTIATKVKDQRYFAMP